MALLSFPCLSFLDGAGGGAAGVGEDAYFSFGLVEELTSRLALVPEIRVVARRTPNDP